MNARDWLDAYAEKLGIARLSTEDFKAVLDLAAEAAHSSDRVAAPTACWLAGRAGVGLDEAIELARLLAGTDG